MSRALDTRDVIGQAKGILMERFGVEGDQAFQMLVRTSQDTNTKLAAVARWLTTSAGRQQTPAGGARLHPPAEDQN
jgi:AmiR/NasT family two-component response regulator